MLSVIIQSKVAALQWCHCCAVNASVIITHMAHSQKQHCDIRGQE